MKVCEKCGRDEWNCRDHDECARIQVERLTRERDEMRAERDDMASALRDAWAEIQRLTRERDEARAELAATERCITPKALETATRVAFEQRDKAERERDEMRKAFRRYAEHDADCPSGFPDPKACECGLSALLKATEVKP